MLSENKRKVQCFCDGIFNHTSLCEFYQGKLLLHLCVALEVTELQTSLFLLLWGIHYNEGDRKMIGGVAMTQNLIDSRCGDYLLSLISIL